MWTGFPTSILDRGCPVTPAQPAMSSGVHDTMSRECASVVCCSPHTHLGGEAARQVGGRARFRFRQALTLLY